MGFYGNITNTSRTQFQFDRTFPNRKVMDEFVGTDGVYIGRYVLIEYDKTLAADWCTTAYYNFDENGEPAFYTSPRNDLVSKILYGVGNIVKGKYIRVPGRFKDPGSNPNNPADIIFNFVDPNETADLIFEIQESETGNPVKATLVSYNNNPGNDYINNYQIDMQEYKISRGYDSTVWQKIYADGKETYVMIAELNSVIPTFDVSADAPSMSPVAPHFDVDSTNIYYRVHWQPSWGLRVKAAAPSVYVKPTLNNGETISGTDIIISDELIKPMPSDDTTTWKRAAYDTKTGELKNYYYDPNIDKNTLKMYGEWIESKDVPSRANFPAAIYYNKAGFDPTTITYSDKEILDKIAIEPTGLSGYTYNQHNGMPPEPQVDTQELTILLPSIGNSIAKMWDMIYGDKNINKSNRRNLTIDWTEGSIVPNVSGLRLVTRTEKGYGFETKNVSTLAGAINSVHDLMGMIIKDNSTLTADSTGTSVQSLSDDYIYYLTKESRYFRKCKKYEYTEVDSFNKDECFSRVSFDTDNWSIPHTNYYLDFIEANPKQADGTPYPNIILERNVWHEDDRQYYTTASLRSGVDFGPYTTEDFDGTFEPHTFFVLADKKVTINQGEVTTQAYQISLDETYQNTSTYYIIDHTPLGDNTRFWIQGEYLIGNFTIYNNHEEKDYNNRILFEQITVDGKTKYVRPESYDPNATYYSATFSTDTDSNYSSNRQYFTVDRRVENNKTYIERTSYIPTAAGEVTAENFYYRSYYITTDRIKYELATQFQSGIQYYTKKVTLELVEGNTTVSAGDVNEVNVVLFEPNQGYCKYIPEGAGGANGYKEYIVLSNPLIPTYANSDNLVQISLKAITNIYQPNLYYYEITDENNPLKGSLVFDSNTLPTEGREYFSRYAATYSGALNYSVGTKVYKPFTYYYKNGSEYILETSEQPVSGREYYIKNNGIYVLSDASGRYPKGMEWNLNVTTKPSGMIWGRRTEVWGLEELYGFARHFNTIHGLILRLTKVLETNNSLTRDYDTVQGVINRMKDLLVQFGEMYPNKVMVTNASGRIITTGLTGDEWIKPSYSDGNNITFKHQNTGDVNNKTLTVSAPATATIPFGGSFTSPSFSLGIDAAGHADTFSTSNNTLTLPTISFTNATEEANVVTNMSMTGMGTTAITIKEERAYVGSLALTGYAKNSADVDITKIAATDSINTAFTKVNKAFNDLDYNDVAATTNKYVSTVTQTNGIISVTTADTTSITKLGTISTGTWQATPIATNWIADSAITTVKINNGAVTGDKLATDSVLTVKIKDGNVTNAKLASGIDGAKISDSTITNAKLASGIDGAKINDGTVTDVKLASGISASKLTTGTLSMARIADGDVTNAKLASGIDGKKVILTGYTAQSTVTNSIASTDSVNVAIRKLEARIIALGG